MLALFNAYDDATRELMHSLTTAGIAFTPVVIRYDGDLPDGALCPFVTYTGLERKGDPLFFNEVPVPAWSEIRQGREVYGEILRDGYPIGRINYEPNSFREVESVDWLLPDRSLSHTDRYDRYGNRYATTHYAGGVAHQTVYEGPGPWRVEVDHLARIVTMRSARTLLTFDTLTEFVSYFLDEHGLDEHGPADGRVLINSLSHPLFVMRRRSTVPRTTLFWQEPLRGGAPPGNMASELDEPRSLERIVFFDEQQRATVAHRHPETAVELAYLSHLGQFADRSGYDPRRAFILTNSDEIPGLAELLAAFPEVTFSVAALTLMSEKLHGLARCHPNLLLTPSISHGAIRTELDLASVYLDLNAGGHVLDVVKAAYHLDLVVLALAPVAKAPGHALVLPTLEELTTALTEVVTSPAERTKALDRLHTPRGPLSAPEDYRRLLG